MLVEIDDALYQEAVELAKEWNEKYTPAVSPENILNRCLKDNLHLVDLSDAVME